MRRIYGICLLVLAATLGGRACAEPSPIGGTASYKGASGDFMVLTIDLDDGHHIEIVRDPMTMVGYQMPSSYKPARDEGDEEPHESLELRYCDAKIKDCLPFYGNILIKSINDHAVTGFVTMPENIRDTRPFAARLAHYQNPLLTGGLYNHSMSGQKIYALYKIHVSMNIKTTVTVTTHISR